MPQSPEWREEPLLHAKRPLMKRVLLSLAPTPHNVCPKNHFFFFPKKFNITIGSCCDADATQIRSTPLEMQGALLKRNEAQLQVVIYFFCTRRGCGNKSPSTVTKEAVSE